MFFSPSGVNFTQDILSDITEWHKVKVKYFSMLLFHPFMPPELTIDTGVRFIAPQEGSVHSVPWGSRV